MKASSSRSHHAATLFAALGDPIRLAMVTRLSTVGPLPTVVLQQAVQVSRQAATKHLQVLQNVGVVQSHRVGRDRHWQIETKRLAEVRKYLDQISAEWDATIERLKQFVESNE